MIWLLAVFHLTASAQSQPEAIQCVEKFIAKMAAIKGYSATLSKHEFYDGEWLVEPIELWAEGPKLIKYTFIQDGSTGIKNNRMQLTYNGTDTLEIKWGEPTFLGALANKAARAVTGDTLALTDEATLKGEFFTLNRAGFYHIMSCLKYQLKTLKETKVGGVVKSGPGCNLKYTPPDLKYTNVHLLKADRVQDVEDRHGTYAFHIRQANSDKFAGLTELFHRTEDVDIRVPEFLLPFEMDLNPQTDLPERFVIYVEGHKMAEYLFSDVKTW